MNMILFSCFKSFDFSGNLDSVSQVVNSWISLYL